MFWVKKLDKSEKILLIGLLVTFLLDLVSTAFAVIKGYGEREMNWTIYNLGWGWGGLITLALNFFVIWIFMKALQAHRTKVRHRFSSVTMVTVFIILRALVVISNTYLGLQPITEEIVKPGTSEVMYSWLTIILPALIAWLIARISFWVFRKSYDLKYKEEVTS